MYIKKKNNHIFICLGIHFMLLSVESIPVIHMLATDQQPIERDGDSIGGVGG